MEGDGKGILPGWLQRNSVAQMHETLKSGQDFVKNPSELSSEVTLRCGEDFSAIHYSKALPPKEWPHMEASPRQPFS